MTIMAEFPVFGATFAEIERAAEVIARKFNPDKEPRLEYSCEQIARLGTWKAEVTVWWDEDAQ